MKPERLAALQWAALEARRLSRDGRPWPIMHKYATALEDWLAETAPDRFCCECGNGPLHAFVSVDSLRYRCTDCEHRRGILNLPGAYGVG